MRRVVIINAKGGCGKTTVATNIASYYAVKGFGTALFDYDPQGSSMNWLKLRKAPHPPIHGVSGAQAQTSVTRAFALRVPPNINRIVLDTPAGLKGLRLSEILKDNDILVIPVVPSAIDLHATADFMRDLLLVIKARSRRMRIAIVANRMRVGAPSLNAFENFVASLKVPVIARLRDSSSYMSAAERGIGVHELAAEESADARIDQLTFGTIVDWIETDPTFPAAPLTGVLTPRVGPG